jgi:hypothetical protein
MVMADLDDAVQMEARFLRLSILLRSTGPLSVLMLWLVS